MTTAADPISLGLAGEATEAFDLTAVRRFCAAEAELSENTKTNIAKSEAKAFIVNKNFYGDRRAAALSFDFIPVW